MRTKYLKGEIFPALWEIQLRPISSDVDVDELVKDIRSLNPPENVTVVFSAFKMKNIATKLRKAIDDELLSLGYTKASSGKYVLPSRRNASMCTRYVEVTQENLKDFSDVLKFLYAVNHDFKSEKIFSQPDACLAMLIDETGIPCSAAIIVPKDNIITINNLYASVSGSGADRSLFERIADIKTTEGYTEVHIQAKDKVLEDTYTEWMGDKIMKKIPKTKFKEGTFTRKDFYVQFV